MPGLLSSPPPPPSLLKESSNLDLNKMHAELIENVTFDNYLKFLSKLISAHRSNPSAATRNLANLIYKAAKGLTVENQIIHGDYSAFSQPRQVTDDMLKSINNPHGFKYAEQYYRKISSAPVSVIS